MSLLLLVSILPLLLGPVLVRLLRPARWATSALDAFVVVTIGGLALLHILPRCFLLAGWPAVVGALAGLLAPIWVERAVATASMRGFRLSVLVFALLALALHAAIDGLALTGSAEHHDDFRALTTAVIVHRFPVGIGLWWFVRSRLGIPAAVTTLLVMVAATLVGFFGGPAATGGLAAPALAVFQAVVAGSLLHVVIGHSRESHVHDHSPRWQTASALGGLLAVGFLVAMDHLHASHEAPLTVSAGQAFLGLALQSAPALLVAHLVVAFGSAVLPSFAAHADRPGSPLMHALRGVGLGVPTTVCSCGVLPPHQRGVVKNAPSPAAVAFLVSSSSLGVAAILLSFELLGPAVAVARILGAVLLALAAGLLVGRLLVEPPRVASIAPDASPAAPRMGRLAEGFRFSFGETIDHTAPWYLMGLTAASFVEPYVRVDWVATIPAYLEVPALALLGLPMYVCASGATPLAAVLLHKGVSAGAIVAFLLTGPATTLAVFGIPSAVSGRRVVGSLVVAMLVLSVGFGFAVDFALPQRVAWGWMQVIGGGHTTIEVVCAVLLAIVVLLSLFRQGVRGFVQQIALTPARLPRDVGRGDET